MTTPPPLDSRPAPPEFDRFADVVTQFADATESLLEPELSHPLNIEAKHCGTVAANSEHPGTKSKQTLLTSCDAAGRRRPRTVRPSPRRHCPVARRTSSCSRRFRWRALPPSSRRKRGTSSPQASREERLRRYLNEELAALYGAPVGPRTMKKRSSFRTDRHRRLPGGRRDRRTHTGLPQKPPAVGRPIPPPSRPGEVRSAAIGDRSW